MPMLCSSTQSRRASDDLHSTYRTRTQTPSFNAHSTPRPPICVARYKQLVPSSNPKPDLDPGWQRYEKLCLRRANILLALDSSSSSVHRMAGLHDECKTAPVLHRNACESMRQRASGENGPLLVAWLRKGWYIPALPCSEGATGEKRRECVLCCRPNSNTYKRCLPATTLVNGFLHRL